MNKFDEILLDLMPDSEKTRFVNRVRNNAEYDHKKAVTALAKLLNTEYVDQETQEVLRPRDIIDAKTVGFVMANPSPQNVKALYELAGIAAPKQIDVTSEGKSVDALLASLSVKKEADENSEVHSDGAE